MLLAAFMLGFVGSLHCAAMCGPLVLAMPVVGSSRTEILASRLVYNVGRIVTYSALGLVFGLIGKSLLLAGLQQSLSIFAGVAMLALIVLKGRGSAAGLRVTGWLKGRFRTFVQRRSFAAIMVLGAINGLLPCGLVYMAGAAAAAMGSVSGAAGYMFVFGLGTVPTMLAMTFCGPSLAKLIQRFRLKPLVPAAVSVVAISLILRGLALGIPYVSPAVSGGAVECSACLKH